VVKIDETGARRRQRAARMGMACGALLGALACGDASGKSAASRPAAQGAASGASAASASPPSDSGRAGGGAASCEPRRLRALLIGTSLTAGYGLSSDQAYPALLQRMADSAGYSVDVVAAGVSGETSAAALRRADWILRSPADLILVETGANDGLRALDPGAMAANIRALLAKARAAHPSARLLLVQMEAPPNLGARYTSRYQAVFPEAARESGATLVPFLLDSVAGRPELNQGDGIHPNAAGSRVVARNVWPSIAAALDALDRCRAGE
jgi:acyl-CoA thioesterase-1